MMTTNSFFIVASMMFFRQVPSQEWASAWRLKVSNEQTAAAGGLATVSPLKIYETPAEISRQMHNLIQDDADKDVCPANKLFQVPAKLHSSDTATYPFLESSLQIFQNLTIPCDGAIKSFHFLSAKTNIYGLHIGVFRPTCSGILQLVSDSYLHGHNTAVSPFNWVSWTDWKAVNVKKGDMLGIFYDRKDLDYRSVTLPSHRPDDNHPRDTLVFLKDAFALAKGNGCLKTSEARATRRIPALYVSILPTEQKTHIVQTPEQGPFLLLPIAEAKIVHFPGRKGVGDEDDIGGEVLYLRK